MKYLFTFILFNIISILTSAAQWTCNGPSAGSITCQQMIGNSLYVGTPGGVFKSNNGGAQFVLHSKNLPLEWIEQLYFDGTAMYAALSQIGVYVSYDTGVTWQASSNGMGKPYQFDYPFLQVNNKVISYNVFGTFYTINHGVTWVPLSLPSYLTGYFMPMSKVGKYLYKMASTSHNHSLYRSADEGQTWIVADTGIAENSIRQVYALNDTIYLFSNQKIYRSYNGGTQWQKWTNPFKLPSGSVFQPFKLCYNGNKFFASTGGNVAMFICSISPKDTQWKVQNNNFSEKGETYAMFNIGEKVYACKNSTLYSLANSNASWSVETNTGIKSAQLSALFSSGDKVFTTGESIIYTSDDNGLNWKIKNDQLGYEIACFENFQNTLYIGGVGIRKSTDDGATWSSAKLQFYNFNCMATDGNILFAGGGQNTVYKTSDGDNWTAFNDALPSVGMIDVMIVNNTVFGTFAGSNPSDQGVYKSSTSVANWTVVNNGLPLATAIALASKDNTIYVGTSGNGVYYSNDFGQNWLPLNKGIEKCVVNDLFVSGFDIFAATDSGVFVLHTGAASWQNITYNLPIKDITKITFNNNYLYAAVNWGSVWQIPITTVGVKHIVGYVNSIDIFPNPANDRLSIITSDLVQNDEIRIMNVNGQLIERINIHEPRQLIEINTSTYSNGMYILQLIGSNGIRSQIWIVQH